MSSEDHTTTSPNGSAAAEQADIAESPVHTDAVHTEVPESNGHTAEAAPVTKDVSHSAEGKTELAGEQEPAEDFGVTPLEAHLAYTDVYPTNRSVPAPETPVALSWSNLSYKVMKKAVGRPAKGEPKETPLQVLDQVSGLVKPGQLLGIIGTTGAGKSSLLNVLADRVDGDITGAIKVNGHPRQGQSFARSSAYVAQDDLLLEFLTVRETLTFSARLRLPNMQAKERDALVDQVIDELGLNKVADSRVGGAMQRGLSGGERKRLAIGVELVTNPTLLFMDEPTSGLDAFTAYNLVKSLQQLAHGGRSVIATVHQPRSNIFNLFDLLCILSQGRVVYFGDAKKAVSYFSSLGFKCPSLSNPADFFIDISTVDARNEFVEKSTARVNGFVEAYKKSTLSAEVTKELNNGEKGTDLGSVVKGYAAAWTRQTTVLASRAFKNARRNPFLTSLRAVNSLVVAVLLGLVYWQIPPNQESVQDRVGLLFFLTINQAFPSMFNALQAFEGEKKIFIRERAAGYYRVSSYFLSKSIAEAAFMLISPLLTVAIVYPMVGLQFTVFKVVMMIVILTVTATTAQSLGLLIASATNSVGVAQALSTTILILLLLFGGFYQNLGNVQVFFRWVPEISFIRWGYEAIALNEFQGLQFECEPEDEVGGQCPIPDGDTVLDNLGFDNASVGKSLLILAIEIVVLRVLAYLLLARKAKERV